MEEPNYLELERNMEKQLREEIVITEGFKLETLARDDLGTFNFRKGLPVFELVISTILDVKPLNLSRVPVDIIQSAFDRIQQANRKLLTVQQLTAAGAGMSNTDNMIAEMLQHWRSELCPFTIKLITFTLNETTIIDSSRRIQNLTDGLAAAQLRAIDTDTEMMQHLAEARESNANLIKDGRHQLKLIDETLSSLGTAAYMKRFQEEADEHKYGSWWWLWATFSFGLFIFNAAQHFIGIDAKAIEAAAQLGLPAAISTASTRLLIMSVLSLGFFLSLRNYSACRHNYIVNKHRINALGTFELFTKDTDAETKKAVLLQSMQAIFSPQSTGYLKGASETPQNTHIIELIQSSLTKGSGTHVG